MTTTIPKTQHQTMRFGFELKSRAVRFQELLADLGIKSRLHKLAYQYTVTTDTRALLFADKLYRFIYGGSN